MKAKKDSKLTQQRIDGFYAVVNSLHALADSLDYFAKLALAEKPLDEPEKQETSETPQENPAPETTAESASQQTEAAASEPQPPDFAGMRRLLTAYAQAGYSHEIKDIIAKYGAKKLSELNPEAYGQVLKEIEAIANSRGGADE